METTTDSVGPIDVSFDIDCQQPPRGTPMNSSRPLLRVLATLAGVAIVLAACGSDDSSEDASDDPSGEPTVTASDETTSEDDADPADDDNSSEDDASPDTSGADHPVVSFAASGPGEPNTFGPSCARGIETTSSNLFRVTAPGSWSQGGSGGGSGPSDIRFEVGDGDVVVDMASTESDVTLIGDVEFGDAVAEADLDGTTAPIVEASFDESTGYAIDGLVWMTDLPQQFGGESAMTVIVSSEDPALPTLDDATAVLSSIRAERCAAISEAVVAASVDRVLAVPEFVDDPLGKTYPGGDQPPLDMAGAVNAWSADQLAYLLPFPEPVDLCVAESLQDELPAVFPLGMGVVSAVAGESQDALDAIADAC